ncbi:hypothetical protein J2S21_004413 [Peribacillus cavernae]|nr:hypothetical protein [Peribacillus cavernae]
MYRIAQEVKRKQLPDHIKEGLEPFSLKAM